MPLRKRVKHYDVLGQPHELTFSCHRRKPLLTCDCWRRLFAQSVQAALEMVGRGFITWELSIRICQS